MKKYQTAEETRASSINVGELLDALDKQREAYQRWVEDPMMNTVNAHGHQDGLEHAGQIARTLAGGI